MARTGWREYFCFLRPYLSLLVVSRSVPCTHSHYLLLRLLNTFAQTSFLHILASLFLVVHFSIIIRCRQTACKQLWRGNAQIFGALITHKSASILPFVNTVRWNSHNQCRPTQESSRSMLALHIRLSFLALLGVRFLYTTNRWIISQTIMICVVRQ